jgi:hypothetical protein
MFKGTAADIFLIKVASSIYQGKMNVLKMALIAKKMLC